jgi:hypothetical protein
MLSPSLGKSEYGFTFWTFTINVGFSVADLVFPELKKSAKFFVFPSALLHVLRKHSEEYPKDKSKRKHKVRN